MVQYAKTSPKMVNPRDVAENAEEKEEGKKKRRRRKRRSTYSPPN